MLQDLHPQPHESDNPVPGLRGSSQSTLGNNEVQDRQRAGQTLDQKQIPRSCAPSDTKVRPHKAGPLRATGIGEAVAIPDRAPRSQNPQGQRANSSDRRE